MPTPNYIRFEKLDELVDDIFGTDYGLGHNQRITLFGASTLLVAGKYLSVNTIDGSGNFTHEGKVNSTDIHASYDNFSGVAALNTNGVDYAVVANTGNTVIENCLIAYNIDTLDTPTYTDHLVALNSNFLSFRGLCVASGFAGPASYCWVCVFGLHKVYLATITDPAIGGMVWSRTYSNLYNAWKVRYQVIAGTKTVIVSARQSAGGAGAVYIFDVDNPLAQSVLATITALPGIPKDTIVATIGGDELLFIATTNGLSVWNVNNPAAPVSVGDSASLHSLGGITLGRYDGVYYAFCTSVWGIIAYEVDESISPLVADYMTEGFTTEYYQNVMSGEIALSATNPSILAIPGYARQVSDDNSKNLLGSFRTIEPTMTISGGVDAVIGNPGTGVKSIVPQAMMMMRQK